MRIETLCFTLPSIQGFALRSTQAACRLEALSGTVNLIIAPAGVDPTLSASDLVRNVISGALVGADSSTAFSVSGNRPDSVDQASVTVLQDGLRRTISCGRDGVWIKRVEADYGSQSHAVAVGNLAGFNRREFQAVFAPQADPVSELRELVSIAAARGIRLQTSTLVSPRRRELQDRLTALCRDRDTLRIRLGATEIELRDRRNRLQHELQERQRERDRRSAAWDAEEGNLQEEIRSCQAEADRLQTDLRILDGTITARCAALESEHHRLEHARRNLLQSREEELAQLENYLANARDMMRQMRTRSRYVDEHVRGLGIGRGLHDAAGSDSICLVESLARQLDELHRDSLRRGADSYPDYYARTRGLDFDRIERPLSTSAFDTLKAEVGKLCQRLQARRELDRSDAMHDELGQIEQCISVLNVWVESLERQYRLVHQELDELREGGGTLRDDLNLGRSYADYLDDYGRIHPARLVAVVHSCDSRTPLRPEDDAELQDLMHRRDRERQLWENAHYRLRTMLERSRVRDDDQGLRLTREMDARTHELSDVETQLSLWDEFARRSREISALTLELAQVRDEVRSSPLLLRIGEILRQITSGELREMPDLGPDFSQANDTHDVSMAIQRLPFHQQQCVVLGFRIALAGLLSEQGVFLPLLVSENSTRFLTAGQIESLVAEITRSRQQAFVFVSPIHAESARRLASQGVRVIEIAMPVATPPVVPQGYVEQVRFEPRAAIDAEAYPYVPNVPAIPSRSFEYFPNDGEPRRYRIDSPHHDDRREVGRTSYSAAQNMPPRNPAVGHRIEFSRHVPLTSIDTIPADVVHRLASLGLRTVGDFLNASQFDLERNRTQLNLSAHDIRTWRQELMLRCSMPDLSTEDVRILLRCGIQHGSDLAEANEQRLYDAIYAQVAQNGSHNGSQSVLAQYTPARISAWIQNARSAYPQRREVYGQDLERPQRGRSMEDNRPTRIRRELKSRRRTRENSRDRTIAPTAVPKRQLAPATRVQRSVPSPQIPGAVDPFSANVRYYLNAYDSVVDAPSIGPKTASALQLLGIRTVHDLLVADAADIATRLNLPRIKGDTVQDWQRQTTLVCRVPELRGHDAQILVACAVRTPEELAAFSPSELWARVRPFTLTAECKRLIRSGKMPDESEVAQWVRYAKMARSLQAV